MFPTKEMDKRGTRISIHVIGSQELQNEMIRNSLIPIKRKKHPKKNIAQHKQSITTWQKKNY